MERETAMKILKELHGKSLFAERTALETLIPELAESEDEKIRKALIKGVECCKASGWTNFGNNVDIDVVLAWLEKQGEQKPDDEVIKAISNFHKDVLLAKCLEDTNRELARIKVQLEAEQKPFDYERATITQKDFAPKQESKFKVGDYIVNDYCMGRIVKITNDAYLLDTEQGIPFSCEHNAHLWTIQDANEGNIIAGKIDGDNYIFIFKAIKDGWIETYGHYYNAVDRFCVSSQLFCRSYQGTFTPATKEQCDLLFQKMKEAGYEWDAEKKELKIVNWSKHIKYEPNSPSIVEQKQEWSEEDEGMKENIEGALEGYEGMVSEDWEKEKEKEWLKSLKDRMKGKED